MKLRLLKFAVLTLCAALGATSPPLSAQSKKVRSPSEKWEGYIMNFVNRTGKDITLTRTSSQCMHDSGPPTYLVKAGDQGDFGIYDNNSSESGCENAPKVVVWEMSSGGKIQFERQRKGDPWQTQVQGPVQSATCDGQNCLAPTYLGSGDPAVILVTF